MTIFTNLTSGGASSATSFTTASVTPTADRLILISVHAYISTGSVQPATPTVTGNGITYDLVRSQATDNSGTDQGCMFLFRGMAAAPTAGTVTISFGAVTMTRCQWAIDQSDATADRSGTNGSGAIVQSTGVTLAAADVSASVNYGTAMTAGNAGFSAWGHQVQEAKTPRSGWTELADVITVTLASLETQYIDGTDTAGSATWTTSSRGGGIIAEIKKISSSSVSFVGADATDLATSVTSVTGCVWPAHASGDLGIVAHASVNTETAAIDALFTSVLNQIDTNLRTVIGKRISSSMTGSESGAISFTSTPTANRQVGLVGIWRGATDVSQTVFQGEASGTATATHVCPTITPTYTGSSFVMVYLDRVSTGNTTVTPPTGWTKRTEFGTSGSGGTYAQICDDLSGTHTASTPFTPASWTVSVASTSAMVVIMELTPSTTATDLTVAAASQAQTSDSPALTQVHNLAVQGATQAQVADSAAITVEYTLAPSAATHALTSDSPSLTQLHLLAVQDAAQAHATDNVALTQVHNLTVAGAAQGQTVDSVPITTEATLGVSSAFQAQESDLFYFTQDHFLALQDSAQAQSADSPTLNLSTNLTVADALQAHAAETPALTQVHNLTVDASLQAQAADAPTLTQVHVLAVQDAAHAQVADSPTLVNVITFAPADATQAQTAGSVTLTQVHVLSGLNAFQAITSDQAFIGISLAPQDATQAMTSDRPLLGQAHNLVVQDATQAQTADSSLISSESTLAPASATHLQTADAVSTSQEYNLAVSDAAHAQTASTFTFAQTYQITPDGSILLQTATHVPVTKQSTLSPNPAFQAVSSESPVLVPGGILTFYMCVDGVTKVPVTIRGMWDGTTVRPVTTHGHFRD